jgi:outer membrane protein OmpA-like peptidoglycan-associated protein
MMKNYIKASLIATATLLSFGNGMAQSPGTHGIEVHGGIREYIGDMGSSLMFARAPKYQGGGLAFTYYISPSIDAVANISFGEVGFSQNIDSFVKERDIVWRSFRAQTGDFTLGARYKLNNNVILSEDSKFAPYLYGGLTGYYVHSTIKWGPHPYTAANRPDQWGNEHLVQNSITDMGAAVQGGLGFKLYLTEALALNWSYTLTYTFNDRWDGSNEADPNPDKPLVHKLYRSNDACGFHAIGLSYALGEGMGSGPKKMKDSDEDGVPNKYDKCKDTDPKYRKFVDNVGCPADSDGDGVLDADDECPDVKGTLEMNGCPDSDGDGVADKNDACPKEKGLPSLKGCPDADNDGISDKEDRCPNNAGTAALKGCPDGDADGVADIDDKCPAKPGSKDFEGCPDTDGDGVFDNTDKCPDKAGTAQSKGCPVIAPAIVQKAKLAATGINFETGNAKILAASNKNLDQLVDIMSEFPEVVAEIEGHTDNQGDASANKKLSQDRADAVKAYLVGKGINADRLKSIGYGQDVPVADNKTDAGRKKNRRVEFKLNY